MEVLADGNRDTTGRNDGSRKQGEISGDNEAEQIARGNRGRTNGEPGKGEAGESGKGGREAGTGESGAAGTRGEGGAGGEVAKRGYKCRNCGLSGHSSKWCPYPKDGKQPIVGGSTVPAAQRAKQIEAENAEKKAAADQAVIDAQKELVLASCEMAFSWWGLALWDYEHPRDKPDSAAKDEQSARATRCSQAAWNLCAAYGWVGPEFAKVLATIAFVGAVGGGYALPTIRAVARKAKEEKRLTEVKPPA